MARIEGSFQFGQKLVLEVAPGVRGDDLVQPVPRQVAEAEADDVGQHAEVGGRDLRRHPARDPRRGVQRDRRPDRVGGGPGEAALLEEPPRVVGAVHLEALLLVRERRQEAAVVEHGRQVDRQPCDDFGHGFMLRAGARAAPPRSGQEPPESGQPCATNGRCPYPIGSRSSSTTA
ncbi:hypothetical protein [Paractinoplanes deccanensis]